MYQIRLLGFIPQYLTQSVIFLLQMVHVQTNCVEWCVREEHIFKRLLVIGNELKSLFKADQTAIKERIVRLTENHNTQKEVEHTNIRS